MPRWRVDIIGLQHIGTVEARTEQEAIEEVAALFRILATKIPGKGK